MPRLMYMSGHCNTPQSANPQESHDRCHRNGGGNRANPDREFRPCPCACHLGEVYECSGCGRPIAEAPLWPNEDEPGEMVYTHIGPDGRAVGEECP